MENNDCMGYRMIYGLSLREIFFTLFKTAYSLDNRNVY